MNKVNFNKKGVQRSLALLSLTSALLLSGCVVATSDTVYHNNDWDAYPNSDRNVYVNNKHTNVNVNNTKKNVKVNNNKVNKTHVHSTKTNRHSVNRSGGIKSGGRRR